MDCDTALNIIATISENVSKQLAEALKAKEIEVEKRDSFVQRFSEVHPIMIAPPPPNLAPISQEILNTVKNYRMGFKAVNERIKEEEENVKAEEAKLANWRKEIDEKLQSAMKVDSYTSMNYFDLESKLEALKSEAAEKELAAKIFLEDVEKQIVENAAQVEELNAETENIYQCVKEFKIKQRMDHYEAQEYSSRIANLEAELQKYLNIDGQSNVTVDLDQESDAATAEKPIVSNNAAKKQSEEEGPGME